MPSRISVGPSVSGLGLGAVALSATITIEETGTIYDGVIQVPHSCCTPTQQRFSGWSTIAVPSAPGLRPAGVLIVPPSTNYVMEVRRRVYNVTPTTTYVENMHKNAPFLMYFDQVDNFPANIDLYWEGQSFADRDVAAVNGSDWFTDEGNALVTNEVVMFTAGTPPAGFTLETPYYVVNPVAASPDHFQLTTTPSGSPITFTDDGASLKYTTCNSFLLLWL